MNLFLTLAFLFFIGCTLGWVLEFFFRRIVHKKWINPGFLVGPYLPLYGFGLCTLFLLCSIDLSGIGSAAVRYIVLVCIITAAMTLLEYVAGIIFIKGMKIKLWDYSGQWGNIQGIICPLFTLAWGGIGAIYLFFIHDNILNALGWLAENLAFSFVIGLFFGVFMVDFAYSMHLGTKIRSWAKKNDVVVKYERFKDSVKERAEARKEKINFLFATHSRSGLHDELENYKQSRFADSRIKWKFFRRNK